MIPVRGVLEVNTECAMIRYDNQEEFQYMGNQRQGTTKIEDIEPILS